MGWCSGTNIFDPVAEILVQGLESDDCDLVEYSEDILIRLINQLQKQDWDTECESKFWEHEIIGEYLGNTFEDYDWEEN